MARQVKCDQCGRAVDTGTLVGGFPNGWQTVITRFEDRADVEQDYCSPRCVVQAFTPAVAEKAGV